jgi:hypothetical protein
MIYFLLIKNNQPLALLEENGLKHSYPNMDYLKGFCDGYLFNYYTIVTPKELADKLNKGCGSLKDKIFFPVTIEDN